MKHLLLVVLLAVGTFFPAEAVYRYRLYLTDKEGSEYCALSERSMERRERQGIELDSTDLCVSPVYLQQLRDSGYQVVVTSRWMNTVVICKPNGLSIPLATLKALPFVADAKQITTTEQMSAPGRSYAPRKRYIPSGGINPPADGETPIIEVKGNALFNKGYRGQGKLVCVLDGGFYKANQCTALSSHIVGWHDMYHPTDTTGIMFDDPSETHGANCLSIMCTNFSKGVCGSASRADYYCIRTECGPSESPIEEDYWIAGAEIADSIGADVISSSLGYYEFDNTSYNYTQSQLGQGIAFVSQGAQVGTTKGMLICVAAGNEGGTSWGAIDFPSDVEDVFSVGATTSTLQPAYFTSPGFLTPYVKPDVACRGQQSYYLNAATGKPATGNGTSYATPLMAGLCTSLWSGVPELTPAQIRDVVRQSATLYHNPNIRVGYGMPQFDVALQLAKELVEGTSLEVLEADPNPEATEGAAYYDLLGRKVSASATNRAPLVKCEGQSGRKVLLLNRR